MKIFSIALNSHDHNTYDGSYHMQSERITRLKHNIRDREDSKSVQKFYDEYYKDYNKTLLAFTLTKLGISYLNNHRIEKTFLNFKPKHLWDYALYKNKYYIDHHQSHATYAYFSSGYSESDILAIDGNGSNFKCIFIDKTGNIKDLSTELSIGMMWNRISNCSGFGHLGAGKLMGLSAYGKINESIRLYLETNIKKWNKWGSKWDLKDIAATLQYLTVDNVLENILPLKTSDNICVAGGVAYNGYMNEELTKHWINVHVPPAVGDEGQSLGSYMHAEFTQNKNIHIPETYAGKEYDFNEGTLINAKEIAQEIANGKIIGWFNGKSESGNRALGNRSILADPRNPNIKDIINKNIKQREDFRPFAPSVLEEYYKDWFDTNQPSPYMSRVVPVHFSKRKLIPGVTHIDNTSRIQTVNKKQNFKFYQIIKEFYKLTGIPMVLNTSFNCREPIVETPEQAINTFYKTKLDMVIINGRCLSKVG